MKDEENPEMNIKDILNEPIAIVGMNCQFPGISADIENVDAFYEMLLKEQTPIKEVPENRWDINQYYDPDRQKEDKIVSRVGGFLENPQLFDAPFFKIAPIETKEIDPQHRLFLEVSIRALNHANITLDSLKNSNTGVYCGISTHGYSELNFKDKIKFNAYTYIGSADSAAAGRLSYFLNLKGPCITVDTACSSSMSALYLATMALRNQQCDMAFVGGVHFSLSPEISIGLSRANMLSALGQCRSFDAQADGYVRSEGCGVVIVKRLSDAIKDNNKIHAVLKGIVMNQDGGGMGMAAPNIEAQIAMHQSLLEHAHLTAGDIGYIETHGTGTVVGDSVEFNAIQSIHQGHHSRDKPLIIGALKSNLGHTISSSGIASLIKVIEAFNHEIIPANLHYSTPSSSINPDNIPALIPVKATPFTKNPNKKRYAQVSNFGFTGTNVSAIIEEPPILALKESTPDKGESSCFVISANSEYSLKQMLKSHLHFLKFPLPNGHGSDISNPLSLHDICYTLINCRDHYKFRCAIIAKNKDELIKKIESEVYKINKVAIDKDIKTTGNDAQQIYEYYLSGANIRSDKKIQYNQVALPLYYFDRKAYWHNKEKPTTTPEDWCFQIEWQYQPTNKSNFKKSGSQWLLIGAKELASGLIQKGLQIVLEEDNYSFNKLDGIIFADGFESRLSKDIDAHIDLQKNILKKLLALIKQLHHKEVELQLIILTANATAELPESNINLDSSPLLGFCKTLALELPQYKMILIDLDKANEEYCTAQIINEMNHNHGQYYEHIIAYRDGKRLVSRLKKTKLNDTKRSLIGEGRYLITGGCGGLGLVTAQALLSEGASELILVSRTIDKPSLTESLNTIQSYYPDRIIRTVSLDITDKEGLRTLLLESNTDGLLKGIIHAAGASINAPLSEHQNEDIDHLFSAKVQGGWYLHELSKNIDLDFFVVYSSISSVFGSNKESVYSATNSFLDALIGERQRLGLVGTSIQWGPWAEVGMAEKRSRDQGLKQALIHNEQGQAFIQLLINGQSAYSTIITPEYLRFMLDFVPKPFPGFYKNLADDLTVIDHSSIPNISHLSSWLSDYFKIDTEKQFLACKNMVLLTCKEILEIPTTEDLDEDAGFFDIGFDSLMMAELATSLKGKLAPLHNVAATVAFDYPSINKLSQHIESELKTHLKASGLQLSSETTDDSIAIIGMSCSLPNAPDITAFELLLENGLSGIKEIPIERWDNKQYYDPNPDAPGKSYVNKLGLIDNIKSFDPIFFGISPREAPYLEPQQRLFLENCYKALEHANYPTQSLHGSLTGVFAGVGATLEYYTLLEKETLPKDAQGMFSVTGKSLNIIPGRVAYTFDFKGPALSIDTACSSSLVAIHYACQSLKNREIDFALAGGVNVILRPEGVINLCKAKALSPESQCKTFDEHADGYVRAEGCGVLFLKRIADALRDNDTILAVIKGSAINNDGKSAGLTVPNGKSQEEVMLKALKQAELSSRDISYIEAHGTGTPLGDPIEIHAINKVYGNQRGQDNPLYVGAVKTNIGHLESASGVAGIIKVIISLQKKRIYKNLNFHRLNPNIKIDDTRIPLQQLDWNTNSKLKCAGINAFGFSGTNAHLILQEFPSNTMQRETLALKTNVLVLSAKTQTALDSLAKRYQHFLETTLYDFNDLCFTGATCRNHFTFRLAVAAKSAVEASKLLQKGEFASSHGQHPILNSSLDSELKLLVTEYLQGVNVDWKSYYKTFSHQLIKVSLPHYTFDHGEFWLINNERNILPIDSIHSQFVPYESVLQHLYDIEWKTLNSNIQYTTKIPNLLVISKNEIRAKKILGAISYQLIEDVNQLESFEDKNIIFLYEQEQFNDLFHCCQRMFQSSPASFILVTENAYAINEQYHPCVNPYHTMASAFWKSFRNELELKKNYTIDLKSDSSLRSALVFVFNTNSEETQFALRDSLYVPRLKRKQLPINPGQIETIFDRDASYLITGGTGGLAKPLIEYLIRKGVKHIIITSRSDCPIDTQTLIENARKKRVSIKHYSADASNFQQMEHILKIIEQSSNPLKGIFHLAGVIHDDLIVNQSDKTVHKVLTAKTEGALTLHQLTKDIQLDMFVLFSSFASILGSRRQSNYVAANGFLDGLAHLRQQQGLPAQAINWGVFQTLGMAEKKIHPLQKRGFIPLGTESMDVLDVLLPSQLAQILLCPIHWDIYFNNTPKSKEFSDLVKTTSIPDQVFLSFLLQHTRKERVDLLSRALCDITADVLGLNNNEQIGIKNDLFAMGMDSLTSLELRNRIHDKLQCPTLSLPIEYFINEPRIDKIAKNIVNELDRFFIKKQYLPLVENSTKEIIRLCDTQYAFWMVNRMDHSFNCAMQLQLKGKLNKEFLLESFDFTINQHSVFWLYFSEDAPVQTLKKQGQFKIIYEDFSLINHQNNLNDVFYDNVMRKIPLTEQPLIRIYLYKLNHEFHELHIIIPHIILDNSSYRILFKQFQKNYETLLLGKKLVPVPEKYTYLDYVKQNNIHYEKDLKTKIDFWRIYNRGFKGLRFGSAHHLPDATFQPQNIFHYPINAQLIERFKDWHKEKNINLSTGLIALCQIVFYKLSYQKKIPIVILHSGREGSRYKSVVGLFTEYKKLNITLNEDYQFLDFLKSIEDQLLKTAPYQKCSQFIKDTGLKNSRLSFGQYLTCQYYKLILSKQFKKSGLNSSTRKYYLRSLSIPRWRKTKFKIMYSLNNLFKLNLSLLKPASLRVLINISPGFFMKESFDLSFSGLETTVPNHYGTMDRPLSNKMLWLFFTKDQFNESRLSINGPLTKDCKDLLAQELIHVMNKVLQNDKYRITELIG